MRVARNPIFQSKTVTFTWAILEPTIYEVIVCVGKVEQEQSHYQEIVDYPSQL